MDRRPGLGLDLSRGLDLSLNLWKVTFFHHSIDGVLRLYQLDQHNVCILLTSLARSPPLQPNSEKNISFFYQSERSQYLSTSAQTQTRACVCHALLLDDNFRSQGSVFPKLCRRFQSAYENSSTASQSESEERTTKEIFFCYSKSRKPFNSLPGVVLSAWLSSPRSHV